MKISVFCLQNNSNLQHLTEGVACVSKQECISQVPNFALTESKRGGTHFVHQHLYFHFIVEF